MRRKCAGLCDGQCDVPGDGMFGAAFGESLICFRVVPFRVLGLSRFRAGVVMLTRDLQVCSWCGWPVLCGVLERVIPLRGTLGCLRATVDL